MFNKDTFLSQFETISYTCSMTKVFDIVAIEIKTQDFCLLFYFTSLKIRSRKGLVVCISAL